MILITGASSGIGEACARELASRGRDLFLVARRMDRLERIAKEIQAHHQTRVLTAKLDVSDLSAVERFGQVHHQRLSQVEVLINNAGLARGISTIQEGALSDWNEMIDTNLKGLLVMTRLLIPRMVENKRGHIVNLGSVAGRWTYPKGNVYCATKAAVRALNESMRLDLLGTGVRVTEIAPGMVETEFSEVRLKDAKKAKAVYAGMKPLSAADVAEAVAWCLDRPEHVNIQELVIYPTDQASPTSVNRV